MFLLFSIQPQRRNLIEVEHQPPKQNQITSFCVLWLLLLLLVLVYAILHIWWVWFEMNLFFESKRERDYVCVCLCWRMIWSILWIRWRLSLQRTQRIQMLQRIMYIIPSLAVLSVKNNRLPLIHPFVCRVVMSFANSQWNVFYVQPLASMFLHKRRYGCFEKRIFLSSYSSIIDSMLEV
jgi:hypothetical protein